MAFLMLFGICCLIYKADPAFYRIYGDAAIANGNAQKAAAEDLINIVSGLYEKISNALRPISG